jgi:general secretion pathway protein F
LADKPTKRSFAASVLGKIRSGATMADALEERREDLPSYYIGMVRAGEASNNLPTIFGRLAELLNRSKTVRENVKSALYYPIIVLVVAAATIVILLTVVVPEFRPLFESAGATLPWPTRVLVSTGDLIRDYWWMGLLVLALAVAIGRRHYSQPAGRLFWDRLTLKVTIVGALVLKTEVARFSRTLGTLLASGVVELGALSIAASTVSNRAISVALSDVGVRLKRGDGWWLPLRESGIFPELAVQMIQVGEESGQLPAMLLQVADIFDEDVQRALERFLALLVPVVTIVLGLIVASIIAAMLLAILSSYSMPI